jgi:hypothetical protein
MKEYPFKLMRVGREAGLPWRIWRNRLGVLCGYVGVPNGHPLGESKLKREPLWGDEPHDASYDWWEEQHQIEVHGGLTFSMQGDGERWPKGYYWLGFDCGHAWDFVPAFHERFSHEKWYGELHQKEVYRDEDYVEEECRSLARQIRAVMDRSVRECAWQWFLRVCWRRRSR